ncbi:MAG: UDP-3-O-(3-hydroxymyristoyl)glucosamine N-acyltransferase [Burkholderiaceae bacterium]|nr:MAG: UDP-3-O-(3-hydroxymyristoyl)glucosamine N-acyltransferase [Burkholderiaceae bacterium]
MVATLGGRLHGREDIVIHGIAPLKTAGAGQISFVAQAKSLKQAAASQAEALILSASSLQSLQGKLPAHTAVIEVDDPYLYYARLSQLFVRHETVTAPLHHPTAAIDASAVVDSSARIDAQVVIEAGAVIGPRCRIGAGSVIGARAQLGADTQLHPRVTLYADCLIGQRCIIHSGAVIGADGFGFANDRGAWVKIAQLGRVVIGDDVEIGANTTIDRGALGDTVIEEGVKLDNQIQIGHNTHIGAHTAMAGCVGVAGSARIGKHCMFGGAAMILGHLEIADRVTVSSGTLISRSITEPGMYTGIFPAQANADWEKTAAVLRQLPDFRQRLKALEVLLSQANAPNDKE